MKKDKVKTSEKSGKNVSLYKNRAKIDYDECVKEHELIKVKENNYLVPIGRRNRE